MPEGKEDIGKDMVTLTSRQNAPRLTELWALYRAEGNSKWNREKHLQRTGQQERQKIRAGKQHVDIQRLKNGHAKRRIREKWKKIIAKSCNI